MLGFVASREAAIQKAEAQKLTTVKHAEADAESKFLQGQGIARQRLAIVSVRPLSRYQIFMSCSLQPYLALCLHHKAVPLPGNDCNVKAHQSAHAHCC